MRQPRFCCCNWSLEAFRAYAWQAFEFSVVVDRSSYLPGMDGSTFDRLNRLHNAAKHADRLIRRGALDIESPLVVWLTNGGLQGPDCHLTFEEVVDLLQELARIARAVQDPASMRDELISSAGQQVVSEE